MAKKKGTSAMTPTDETGDADQDNTANGTTDTDTGTTSGRPAGLLTIQGLQFPMPRPFAEGHTCTIHEADALNQVMAENVRNNFADKIKKAHAAQAATLVAAGATQADADAAELSETAKAGLLAEFSTYVGTYSFAAKRARTISSGDPFLAMCEKIAKEMLDGKLREHKIDKKTLADGQYANLVSQLIENNPAIKAEAQIRIDARKATANATTDFLTSMGLTTPAAA